MIGGAILNGTEEATARDRLQICLGKRNPVAVVFFVEGRRRDSFVDEIARWLVAVHRDFVHGRGLGGESLKI